MNHTKLPWFILTQNDKAFIATVVSELEKVDGSENVQAEFEIICGFTINEDRNPSNAYENAKFVLRAVSNYYKLFEALKNLNPDHELIKEIEERELK